MMIDKLRPARCIAAVILGLVLNSCVNLGTTDSRRQQASHLSRDLQSLSPNVDQHEADRVAATAIEESAKLSENYRPVALPWFNNWLVNRGLRDRGLCYQWRNDLFPHLYRLQAKTLELHLATSRKGSLLEHNAIVVTARGQAFEQGLILDPWRGSGKIWWGRFDQDSGRPWRKLHRDQTPMSLRPLLMPQH